ncbi:MAG TPA: hypothetical protein VN679_11845 [Candidatus Acidoferrales bacterium]|nr:hypothetical protein [Candidatus Acidoferrales bacterium]
MEEKLLASGKYKIGSAIHTFQNLILELHLRLPPFKSLQQIGQRELTRSFLNAGMIPTTRVRPTRFGKPCLLLKTAGAFGELVSKWTAKKIQALIQAAQRQPGSHKLILLFADFFAVPFSAPKPVLRAVFPPVSGRKNAALPL